MKRALSLIIVLAMVLCLIPFSAFAEGEVWGVNGDFEDATVTLNEDNNYEASTLYTAPEAGTVCFYLNVYTEGVEGVNIYINGELYEAGTDIAVAADDKLDVTVSSDNTLECEVYVYHNFLAVPGTENNPLWLSSNNTTIIVPANSDVWYQLYAGGYIVSVSQGFDEDTADFSVVHNNTGEKYTPDVENYIFDAQFLGVGSRWGGGPDVIKIYNRLDVPMYYVVSLIAPEGHSENPMPIYWTDEAVTGSVAAGGQGFYYTYTPYQDGTLSVTVGATDAAGEACGWTYAVNNLTTYAYGDTQWSDSDPVVNPYEVEVSANDTIQIIVNTYDPLDPWTAPAGTVSVTLGFEAAPEEPETPVVEEAIVAEYNGEQMGLTKAIELAAADGTSETPAIVTLIDNYTDETATIIVEPNVVLDIAGCTLTARNVIGLAGSYITGNAPTNDACDDGGKIVVGRANLVMDDTAYVVAKGSMLPVWNNGNYIFALCQINFPSDSNPVGGLSVTSDQNDGYSLFAFKANFSSKIKNKLFAVDGTAEHALNMIISVSWIQEGVEVTQEFFFPKDLQISGMSKALWGDLVNCNNYSDLEFAVKYVTESGATMTSQTFKYADYIG